MADNTVLNQGAGGDVIATDDISGVKHQLVKMEFGQDGVAKPVSTADPLPVELQGASSVSVSNFPASQVIAGDVSVNNFPTTQPVSGTVAVNNFPSSQEITGTVAISGTVPVSGTFFQTTQPVSVATLPLPSGAATSSLQGTGNSSLSSIDSKVPALGQALAAASTPVVLPVAQITALTPPSAITGFNLETTQSAISTVQGAISDAIVAAGATGSISAKLRRVTQGLEDLKSLIVLAAGTNVIGKVGIDQTTPGTTNLVALTAETTKVIGTVNLSSNQSIVASGNVASGVTDSGNPIKIGGKVSISTPTPVSDGQRVDALFDEFGRQVVSDRDVELAQTVGLTGLRDQLVAQRHTVIADSLADGIAAFWSQTTANGGTITQSGGEGLFKTSIATNGSARMSSPNISYLPGQVAWMNSAIRFEDTGLAGCTIRIGMFSISGDNPLEGFYYELAGTALSSNTVKAGVVTSTAQSSWTRNSVAPFTMAAGYASFEIRYTANTVWFYINNVLRNSVSGTTASLTSSLSLPMTIQIIKTSGATDRTFAVRNIGNGRFGEPTTAVVSGTTTTFSATTSSGTVLDTNFNRLGANFWNEGTSNVYIKFGATASTTSYTLILYANSGYELTNGYKGKIDGITASGTATLRVVELT